MNNLDQLIDSYAKHKAELEDLKKTVENENKQLKKMMEEQSLTKASSLNYTVNYLVQNRESWNEDRLIEVLKYNKVRGVIKKKEYVDGEELERLIYKGNLSNDVLMAIDDCHSIKQVITLRIKHNEGE